MGPRSCMVHYDKMQFPFIKNLPKRVPIFGVCLARAGLGQGILVRMYDVFPVVLGRPGRADPPRPSAFSRNDVSDLPCGGRRTLRRRC